MATTLTDEQNARLGALSRKAESGEQWAAIARLEADMLREALEATTGHMLNAVIGLQTGATKATTTKLLSDGIEIGRVALAKTAAGAA